MKEHPYAHPTLAVIPVGVAVGIINIVATVAVAQRATSGLGARSRPHSREIAVMVILWIGVFAVLGVMAGAGVSNSIVYGRYPASAPLIAAGLAWAAITAARTDWKLSRSGLAAAVVGVIAACTGPATAWAVAGVGVFGVLLIGAAERSWRLRAQ